MYKAIGVAQYVINYSFDNGNPISNLKLQKLLYYIQAAFLVQKGEPCFVDTIEHWRHGPVISEVYSEYKSYLDSSIQKQDCYLDMYLDANAKFTVKKVEYSDNNYCEQDKKLMNKVIDSYFKTSAWNMVSKTHQEKPWKETDSNEEITKESIRDYFMEHEACIYGNM